MVLSTGCNVLKVYNTYSTNVNYPKSSICALILSRPRVKHKTSEVFIRPQPAQSIDRIDQQAPPDDMLRKAPQVYTPPPVARFAQSGYS